MNKTLLLLLALLVWTLSATTQAQSHSSKTPPQGYNFDSLFAELPACNGAWANEFEMEIIDGGYWPAGGASLLQTIQKPKMGRLHRLDSIATDADRLWLKALAKSVKMKPAKLGNRFLPVCKSDPGIDLGATELNEILGCLYQPMAEFAEMPAMDRKLVLALNCNAVAGAYLGAPTRYLGAVQAASTPLGPGFAFKVWTLQRFDPEWQWALSEATFLLHYQDRFLDGLAVHTARIEGKYSYDFYGQTEQIKVFQWTGDGSLLEVEIVPSEGGEEAIDFGIRRGVLLPGGVEE